LQNQEDCQIHSTTNCGLRWRPPWQAGSSWEYASVSTIIPKQLAIRQAFHQQTYDELGGNELSGMSEEGMGADGLGSSCWSLGGSASGASSHLKIKKQGSTKLSYCPWNTIQ